MTAVPSWCPLACRRLSSPGALLRALLEPDLHDSMSPALLLKCDNDDLFSHLPLVLAAVQRIGEMPRQRVLFTSLVQALRARVTSCRSVKLRLMLIAQNPGFADFWHLKLFHRSQAYPAAWATMATMLHDVEQAEKAKLVKNNSVDLDAAVGSAVQKSTSESGVQVNTGAASSDAGLSSNASKLAAEFYEDNKTLFRYAVRELFASDTGVPMRNHVRRLRVVPKSFYASELVDTIMERVNFADRSSAVEIGQRLQDSKLITRVSGTKAKFSDDDKLYQSKIALHSSDGDYACIKTTKGEPIMCWKEFQSTQEDEPVKSVEVRIPCDLVDLQSLQYWTGTVYLSNPVKGHSYGYTAIAHPMITCRSSEGDEQELAVSRSDIERNASEIGDTSDDTSSDGFANGSFLSGVMDKLTSMENDDTTSTLSSENPSARIIVHNVRVRKVFSSIARPMIIELRRPREDCDLDDDETHDVVNPNLIVKEGDNLGQDMCVELMFKCFNTIWQNTPDLFSDSRRAPFAFTYEVFPTAVKRGFMEAVPGLTSLNEFDWDDWRARAVQNPALKQQMVSSAAGSYVAAAILGAADRHPENVQIQDGKTMMHIDFGFLLGSKPPIDGPRFAIYPQMQTAFEKAGVWKEFVQYCEDAFLAVRRQSPTVIRAAVMLFSKVGFDEVTIRDFLNNSLDTHQKSAKEAGAVIHREVLQSSSMWKTKFKSYSHSTIDPAFYSALEKRFPPAVLAMKIVDAKQQAASRKLELNASKSRDGSSSEDRLVL